MNDGFDDDEFFHFRFTCISHESVSIPVFNDRREYFRSPSTAVFRSMPQWVGHDCIITFSRRGVLM